MKRMLVGEFNPAKLQEQLINCCTEHDKVSDDLKKLAIGIDELHKL
jgi:hypothetical protein